MSRGVNVWSHHLSGKPDGQHGNGTAIPMAHGSPSLAPSTSVLLDLQKLWRPQMITATHEQSNVVVVELGKGYVF